MNIPYNLCLFTHLIQNWDFAESLPEFPPVPFRTVSVGLYSVLLSSGAFRATLSIAQPDLRVNMLGRKTLGGVEHSPGFLLVFLSFSLYSNINAAV